MLHLISVLAFIPFVLCAPNWVTVHTSNGPITGHTTDGNVVEYLGIPYAEPPVRSLRFMPPQKLKSSRPYEAAHWGYDCPRLSSRSFNYTYLTAQAPAILAAFTAGNGTQSEDCLTLNIWSKPTPRSVVHDKPVFVFFYGGRFAGGNTNTPFWNGRHFAASEDIIVITVNYRINILGFPGSCSSTPAGCVQNHGLRDQRLAVEWIRDNIAAFGGNPQKIVIAGQSSGAVSVDYWAYAYVEDPIVAGLIMHSGSALSFPLNTPEYTAAAWRDVVRTVRCGSNSSDSKSSDEVHCMQQKDWEDIRTAAANVKPDSSTNNNPLRSTPAFYPVVDNETVFANYSALNKAGLFAKLPILIGHNDKEEGYYALSSLSKGISALPSKTQMTEFHLSSFTCPIAAQADARTAHNVPVWQYRYFGNWINVQLYNHSSINSSSALAALSGAYHGSDLFMLFGTSRDVTGLEASVAEKQTVRMVQRAWAVFCDFPGNGLSGEMQWPVFSRESESLVRLGYRDSPTPDFVRPGLYDGGCKAF